MSTALDTDLRNIAEWSEACARHHMAGAYREALMHGRLVGEAACRVIIRMAWAGRRGEEGVAEPTYDRQLRLIQGSELAPPAIVSALHVMRTRGNNATHGQPVSVNDSAGALFMLHALLEHIHVGLLQRPVPATLATAIDHALGGRTGPANNEVLREVLREEANVGEARQAHEAANEEDLRRIEAEQELHRARMHDMEELLRQMAARETTVEQPPMVQAPAPEPPAARKPRTRWWIAGVLLLMAAIVSFLLVRTPAMEHTAMAVPAPDSTVTTVLILPFVVMQDDPNLNLHFERAIADRIETRIRARGLAMRVFVVDTALRALPMEEHILAIARRHHADLVIHGELFEPTATDSGRVHIRFISTGAEQWPKGDLGPRAFRSLADSAAIRTQLAAQAIAELSLANRLYATAQPSAALAVLYDTPLANMDWTVANHILRARCHRMLGDLGPSMRELEVALALDPENAGTLAYMGRVLQENGNHTAAIGFYEKAIEREPRNATWMLRLAHLMSDRSRPADFNEQRVRVLSQRALAADSTSAGAWLLHGQVLFADGHITDARNAFERAITLNPQYAAPKYDLASVLIFHGHPPEYLQAEALLREALRLDSTDTRVSMLLARVLTEGPHKDPVLAGQLFARAQMKDPHLERQALLGRAMAAVEAGDEAQALHLYQQVWAVDSTDIGIGVRISVLLKRAGRPEESLAMLLRCHALDSMHHNVNLNLGILYLDPGTAPERKRAIAHLDRAMATDPHDGPVLERLGMALAEDGQYARALPVLEHLLRIDPHSHLGNGYMGVVLQRMGRATEAMRYYEQALITDPHDPVICTKLGDLYAEQQPPRYADALVLLQRALKQQPADARLHMSLCAVLANMQDHRRAATHYRQAVELEPRLRSPSVEQLLAQHGAW